MRTSSSHTTNIVLIGYRGSGKSTIGRALAARLGRGFVDTDLLIVERAGGCTIKEIFEREGERGFRDRETDVLREVADRENLVIAAGGGAILRAENVALLKKSATIVWLQADAETLHARITADVATNAMRPNLTAAGGLEEVRTLLAERTPHYAAAADITLDIAGRSVEEAVDSLLTILNSRSA